MPDAHPMRAPVAPGTGSAGGTPPDSSVRAIGVLWLLYFVLAFLSLYLTRGILVPGNAAATAANLLAHAPLFQAGSSVDLVANASYIALAALLYGLFRPVHPTLALLAAFFAVVGCAVQIIAGLLRIAAGLVLTESGLPTAFTPQQLSAASLLSLMVYARAFQVSFVLFGLFELVLAYLILKSDFLPKWIGWLWVAAGAGWLSYLWLPLARLIQPAVLAVGGVAELVLMLWLLVRAADVSKRRALAAAGG